MTPLDIFGIVFLTVTTVFGVVVLLEFIAGVVDWIVGWLNHD